MRTLKKVIKKITAQEETKEEKIPNALQFEYIRHIERYGDRPFYIYDNAGRMWRVSEDGDTVVATPYTIKYEVGDESAVYYGDDAWDDLLSDLDLRFSLPKMEQVI